FPLCGQCARIFIRSLRQNCHTKIRRRHARLLKIFRADRRITLPTGLRGNMAKTRLLLTTALPLAVLMYATPSLADECNWNLGCEASRFEYWVQHGTPPAAKLTTTPSQPAAPAASAADVS